MIATGQALKGRHGRARGIAPGGWRRSGRPATVRADGGLGLLPPLVLGLVSCLPAGSILSSLGSPVVDYLQTLHAQLAGLEDGAVATYIPELAHAKKSWFGICLATTDGQVYEIGDTRLPFTIPESAPRSATTVADRVAECCVLGKEDLTHVWDRQPRIKAVMLGNIAFTLAQRLRKTNGTIAALAR